MVDYSKHSMSRLLYTMAKHEVPRDFADPISRYLLYGLPPGSFFTSLLANDAFGAISRSHPINSLTALKYSVRWMQDHLRPGVHYGSYDVVEQWIDSSYEDRRKSLESCNLIYDGQTEMMMILKDEPLIFNGFYGQ